MDESFSLFKYKKPGSFYEYFMFGNRGPHTNLIPEKKEIDYFFMIRGSMSEGDKTQVIIDLKSLSIILTILQIDPFQLKSRENLIL